VRGLPLSQESGDGGQAFHVQTVRRNPAGRGHVTGSATLQSFLSSMLRMLLLSLQSPFQGRPSLTWQVEKQGCFLKKVSGQRKS